ncbi:hypothetical protein OSB04_031852 [Centaurea solstitialis]|uniref:Uncharacterized protein n=1 Tax=Centaurea solstitialis TaxID=347529 RepID=A0AA38W6E9_9ASTR|nr:hypothetical protein OSB04_031852 [Centaurea solstitialis]
MIGRGDVRICKIPTDDNIVDPRRSTILDQRHYLLRKPSPPPQTITIAATIISSAKPSLLLQTSISTHNLRLLSPTTDNWLSRSPYKE